MRRTVLLVVIVVAVLAGSTLADEQELLRVHEPSRPPDDLRLTETHDIDHPVDFKPHFKDKADWERRANELRTQVLVAEGLWPMPERTPLNAVVHGKIDRDDYTIEKVYFASYPGHYICGNLYRPKGKSGPVPGVLCPHGHWANGRFYDAGEKAALQQIAQKAEMTIEGA